MPLFQTAAYNRRRIYASTGPSLAIHAMSATIRSVPGSVADIEFSDLAMATDIGDLVVIWAAVAHLGTSGTSAICAAPAVTNWNNVASAIIAGPAEDVYGIRAIWKVWDGTEPAVLTLFTASGAAGTVTTRISYCGATYSIIGSPALGTTPLAQATSGDPTAQTILSGGATGPCVAFAWASALGGVPAPTFVTQTPDQELIYTGGSTPNVPAHLKVKIFPSSPANITTDVADLGTGNTLLSGYIQVT